MAELPEIAKLSEQMRDVLCGKTIQNLTLQQEKCANPFSYSRLVKDSLNGLIGGCNNEQKNRTA